MSAKVETVTPAKARAWLRGNNINRPLTPALIDKYAGAMKRGEWMVNGEAIILNCDGSVGDGQHRLNAIVQSNCTIQSYVIRGIQNEAFETLGQGKPRSFGDILGRRGEKHYTALAAAVRNVWVFSHAPEFVCSKFKQGQTNAQLSEVLNANPGVRECVEFSSKHRLREMMAVSAASALMYYMRKKDRSLADTFWEKVATGEKLLRSDAAYKLRELCIRNRTEREGIHQLEIAANAIIAWNCLRAKKSCKTLKWVFGDKFPSID